MYFGLAKHRYIAIGGFIGTILRYLISLTMEGSYNHLYETILVNVSGSFLLGLLFTLWNSRSKQQLRLRLCFGTGLMGSFTTFSTFSLHLVELFNSDTKLVFWLYAAASVMGSIVLTYLGIKLGQYINSQKRG